LVQATFSAPVQNGPRLTQTTCAMRLGTFLEVQRQGRDVDHPQYLAPNLKIE